MRKSKKKISTIGWVGIGTVSITSLLGIGYLIKRRRNNSTNDFNESYSSLTPPSTNSSTPKNSTFPLQKGSRGTLVRQLQQFLIHRYGNSILPKWGADGIWGSETQSALISKGLPTFIDSNTFTQLTQGKLIPTQSFNPESIANELWQGTIHRNYGNVKSLLSQLNSTNDYVEVSNIYKTKRINGVRKTLVNGLFDTFRDSTQRKQIQNEFLRMGLKYNGSTWSLSGLNGFNHKIKTTVSTLIWGENGEELRIPAGTTLGAEIQTQNGVTTFASPNGSILYVNQNAIAYA